MCRESYTSRMLYSRSLNTFSFTDSEVHCTGSVICRFITQVPLQPGEHGLFHQLDADAVIDVTVYGFIGR